MRTLLTVKGVAACLRVSTKTVYRLCALGELRHIRVLNAITMAPADVDALVFARRV
ncbi:MAG: helix-turn-helix domain-containing protein [Deltaproteobacteria bacterium]|nr:MAG: helix-turn-helix domain-containing protein [Deltaproteobacteria bacterium]